MIASSFFSLNKKDPCLCSLFSVSRLSCICNPAPLQNESAGLVPSHWDARGIDASLHPSATTHRFYHHNKHFFFLQTRALQTLEGFILFFFAGKLREWSSSTGTRAMGYPGRAVAGWKGWTLLLWVAAVSCILADGRRVRQARCPAGCTCTKDNALCENVRSVPHAFPSDVVSL